MGRKKGNTAFDSITRRHFLGTLGAGTALSVAGITLGRTKVERNVLRPPGAIEERAFLSLCARCGRCVPVCPNTALQLQGLENGPENLMTPKLVPKMGHCIMPINGCQNCIEACPAKVLQPLDIEGVPTEELSKVIKIGTATLDTTLCIPYAQKQPCLACWEICPVVGAITIHGGKGKGIGGSIRKPEFNRDVCVGCGACEYACPTNPKAVQIRPDGSKRTEWK
jgi:ferredoxin